MNLNPMRRDSPGYVAAVGFGGLVIALILALLLGGCDDGTGRHAPQTCRVVTEVSCVATKHCVRCALLSDGQMRANTIDCGNGVPSMQGDNVCAAWVHQ